MNEDTRLQTLLFQLEQFVGLSDELLLTQSIERVGKRLMTVASVQVCHETLELCRKLEPIDARKIVASIHRFAADRGLCLASADLDLVLRLCSDTDLAKILAHRLVFLRPPRYFIPTIWPKPSRY